MSESSLVRLSSARDTITVDTVRGCIISFINNEAPERELLSSGPEGCPLFLVHYFDERNTYREIVSSGADRVTAGNVAGKSGGGVRMSFQFSTPSPFVVSATIAAETSDWHVRFSLALGNNEGLRIADIVFPVMTFKYNFGGTPESESVVFPVGPGKLYSAVKEEHLLPDSPRVWNLVPEMYDFYHYPGDIMAQFLAHYDDSIGVYVCCDDEAGFIKRIQPVHRDNGVHLGFSHIGDWPERGSRDLEYSVKARTFEGDWYDAAALYREWTEGKPWTSRTIAERTDVPAWLLESPPALIVRLQGLVDDGPAAPIEEFLPYKKIVPLLEPIGAYLDAPLVPMIMTWERPGPWVYPDCFPPVGGKESLAEFSEEAARRRWHVGSFCNGTRWVTRHWWTGYDGDSYFDETGGEDVVCRLPDGSMWKENWDHTWRESFACCLGVEKTKTVALDFMREMIRLGLDWIQFLDQNNGCATFPCFSRDHGHPSVPGRWMTVEMIDLLKRMRELADETLSDTGGKREIVYSVERPVNELLIPYMPVCDIRVVPPGHSIGWGMFDGFVPLYHFLYHHYILIQGGFGTAPEPYHLQIRNTYNLVVGEVPGAVLQGDGKLLNKDTVNWARWEPEVGSNDDALFNIRAALRLRRGAGKDFLVFGKMLKPAEVEGIETVQWQYERKNNRIPSVFHSSWQALDGRPAVVLGNWTGSPLTVGIKDNRLGCDILLTTSGRDVEDASVHTGGGTISVTIPALGFALVSGQKT